MTTYLVHVGYSLMLCALLARDILWLRGILIFAQGSLAHYAYINHLISISFWNWIFVIINFIWVIRILKERHAVELPVELVPIYEKHFAALTPSEFLRFWSWAEKKTANDITLVTKGSRPVALYFLLSGTASVSQDGKEIARIQTGAFAAEMSLLTGGPTTADVIARGEIIYMAWPMEHLTRVHERNPVLWTKIQSVIGLDLVKKIGQASGHTS
ncbi:MAG: cyclic nucleotide-binding domain-containing protein [Gammaproteobacteria bacterium]|nr:cyclic nucleotide-binding domain-containing protein [Gammaproteobacteria bacterium]